MGFFEKVLGAVAGHGGGGVSSEVEGNVAEDIATCPFCGWEGDSDEISVDYGCTECADGFPRYCCGGIYEQGEDTCASCGEPL